MSADVQPSGVITTSTIVVDVQLSPVTTASPPNVYAQPPAVSQVDGSPAVNAQSTVAKQSSATSATCTTAFVSVHPAGHVVDGVTASPGV